VRYPSVHGLRVGEPGLTLAEYGAVDLLHEEVGATTFRVEITDLFVICDPLARVHLFSEIDMVDQENPHEQRRTFLTDRLFGDFAGFDWLNLRVGKFLTPIGRWNQIHARPLVWTTSRPLATTLPFDPYVTGAMLFGSRFPRAGTLTYSLYGQFTNSFDVEPPAQPMDRGVGGRVEYASFGGWSVAGSYLAFTALPGEREPGGTAAGDERGWRHLAGLDTLWRAHGRLPWARLVEPALRVARDGVAMPAAHAACLAMLAPVMTMREGASMYAPGGALLADGDVLRQPGLVRALELVRDEGAATVYSGSIAAALLALVEERGGAITRSDLDGYTPVWSEPVDVAFAGRRVTTRGGLSGIAETLARFEPAGGEQALLDALESGPVPDGHTTNFAVVDADGNACVLTTSLGLGSGDWLPGLDLHLNSMLGETDLIRAPLRPGERMASMMAPTLVFDSSGAPELALGAAGGTRLRTALVGVLGAVLHEGIAPQAAIDRPRFHPAGAVLNAEPGVDERWLQALERAGRTVRRWPARHHYFGGVSAVGRSGAGADPRRSGAVRSV